MLRVEGECAVGDMIGSGCGIRRQWRGGSHSGFKVRSAVRSGSEFAGSRLRDSRAGAGRLTFGVPGQERGPFEVGIRELEGGAAQVRAGFPVRNEVRSRSVFVSWRAGRLTFGVPGQERGPFGVGILGPEGGAAQVRGSRSDARAVRVPNS
ncbi:hypothetical protein J2Z65_001642 [Paenibacillus aceris]|uniref:Uncharacterized protein n=1 Tax=Paenibacillus aceris TaxID=869555 RepID=A0ABS4HUZ1_9BACL|nr:hypothetical protein [Paenibacillus aceris]